MKNANLNALIIKKNKNISSCYSKSEVGRLDLHNDKIRSSVHDFLKNYSLDFQIY